MNKIILNDEQKAEIKTYGVFLTIIVSMYALFMVILTIIEHGEDIYNYIKEKFHKKERFNAHREVNLTDYDFEEE